jgi:hypothetical protein
VSLTVVGLQLVKKRLKPLNGRVIEKRAALKISTGFHRPKSFPDYNRFGLILPQKKDTLQEDFPSSPLFFTQWIAALRGCKETRTGF